MRVSGTGAQWVNTGSLIVGDVGRGTIDILQGGRVDTSVFVNIAQQSSGSIAVRDANSHLESGWIDVGAGDNASGTLSILDGATAHSFGAEVPFAQVTGATGFVTVGGAARSGISTAHFSLASPLHRTSWPVAR